MGRNTLGSIYPDMVFVSLSQSVVWVDSPSTKRDPLGESDLLDVSSGHCPHYFWVSPLRWGQGTQSTAIMRGVSIVQFKNVSISLLLSLSE